MKRNKIKCQFTQGCSCPAARQPTAYTFTYISEELSTIYYNIPKAASTSIRCSIFKNNNIMSLSNPSGKLQDYFKFTFCRNPYSRVVSNYIMFTTSRNIKIDEFRINQICQFHNNPSSMSFSEFLEFICKYDNHHWQPQIDFVYGYDVDFIGRVENYQEDFNTICDKIGIPRQELLHKNKSKHKHYTEYYDDETREIVAEKYKKDIEYFGYKFGE